MTRFLVLSLAVLLAGCATPRDAVFSTDLMTITVPDAALEELGDSPLSDEELLLQELGGSVPLFRRGTGLEDVRAALDDWNVEVLLEWPGFIVVRENTSRLVASSGHRQPFIYAFDDGRLVLGPLTWLQLHQAYAVDGLNREELDVLRKFGTADEYAADNFDHLARLLATYPDDAVRSPAEAIELAQAASTLANYEEWSYVDTLAAALAAAGEYAAAAEVQREAISMRPEEDPAMRARLQLYERQQPYLAPPGELYEPAGDEQGVQPRSDLYAAAVDGSPDAQFELAVFYFENDIASADGIDNPGLYWLERAAMSGHAYAANEIGFGQLYGTRGLEIDFPGALGWFRLAAQLGDPLGAFNAGRMLADGIGVAFADEEATSYLTAAADAGIASAAFKVAYRYAEGVGVQADAIRAAWYLQLALDAGYRPADFVLEDYSFDSLDIGAPIAALIARRGVRPAGMAAALLDIESSFEQASRGAGETFSIQLGDDAVYEFSTDVAPTILFALTRMAASLGSEEAQRKLARMHTDGPEAFRSPERARYWLQRADRHAARSP